MYVTYIARGKRGQDVRWDFRIAPGCYDAFKRINNFKLINRSECVPVRSNTRRFAYKPG